MANIDKNIDNNEIGEENNKSSIKNVKEKVKKLSCWAKLFLFCFFGFIFLVVSLLIAINIPSVKDKLAKEAIGFLNKEFKTTFSAENVEINFLGDVVINGISAKDHHDFEFLKAKKLTAHSDWFAIAFNSRDLKFQKISLEEPDLKVIITSATIDAERFSQHFNNAPVIEVSGRTYPVEVLYRPLNQQDEDEAEIELADAIVDAVDELAHLGQGDVLVFLSGEREIREAAEALRKSSLRKNDDILPLFARLSAQEQHKIFHPTGDKRRLILATNVAETSLTVPRIKYVVDTGLARVKRYSARAKVEQLHVEKISQAACKQRSGRCGRISAGVCIRLFSEEDFNQRSEFTDPEILRSNLSGVILRLMSLGFGDMETFPLLDMPEQRYINDGYQVLLELGAIENNIDV